jgi:hypothetical protein
VFEVEAFRTANVDALWLSAEVEPDETERVEKALHDAGALQVSLAAEGRR